MNHDRSHKALLLLGSNLNDRYQAMSQATHQIKEQIGEVDRSSSIYETEPWGFEHENAFLNQVLMVRTALPPYSLLDKMLEIEKEIGRKRSSSEYEARLIDIDLLFYDEQIIHSQRLTIPHPHLHKRRFTLVPLVEIVPNWYHPVEKKTLRELLSECPDKLEVKRYSK